MQEDNLITTYSASHQNKINQQIHFVCVPVIYFNVIAYIYYFLPLVVTLLVVAGSLVYYFMHLRSFLPHMLVLNFVSLLMCYFFSQYAGFIWINTVLFILAWIAQFVGHKIEGKNPSFFQNVLFLLVGPAWVMAKFKKKILG